MKIKIEGDKIIKAVKKLDGIELVIENTDDAREAFNLILRKSTLSEKENFKKGLLVELVVPLYLQDGEIE